MYDARFPARRLIAPAWCWDADSEEYPTTATVPSMIDAFAEMCDGLDKEQP